jgi:predicted dehydrogenase
MKKIRWGVLGAAKIATVKVIPAMQQGTLSEVTGLASRELSRAQEAAGPLGIAKAYGSYEELLADPDIDAIYNPLPNHLHVPWTIRAAEAGKHVLCEKPIALTAEEAKQLLAVRDRTGVKIGEAFMVHTHPQWLRAIEILKSGEIGRLRGFNFVFSYNNRDPKNIRNRADIGGGALMDIGCYPIHTSRWVFGEEPKRVVSLIERDPDFGTDRLTSAILDFPGGHAVFTCSTQASSFQRAMILGDAGRIEIEVPVNAPPDTPNRIFVHTTELRTETFPVLDQYTIQGDAFSRAILENGDVPVSLEDAVANMRVIDGLFASGETGHWQMV